VAQPTTNGRYHEEAESSLVKRACLVLSIAGLVVLILWITPPLLFNLGVVAVTVSALHELYLLEGVSLKGRTYRMVGLSGGTLMALQMALFPNFPFGITIPLLMVVFLSFAVVKTTAPSMEELRELMFVMFGMFYVGGVFGQLILIRTLSRGRDLAALVILTVLAREVGATIGGRLPVSSKLLNVHINRKKSYAGAIVGIAAGILVSVGLARHFKIGFSLARASGFGLCLGVACQFGDLAESYLKRAAGRRHSGNLLGPEGGLLDFLDAAAFAIVVARLLLYVWGY
jgi:phosphatidate cytidylyltransferase